LVCQVTVCLPDAHTAIYVPRILPVPGSLVGLIFPVRLRLVGLFVTAYVAGSHPAWFIGFTFWTVWLPTGWVTRLVLRLLHIYAVAGCRCRTVAVWLDCGCSCTRYVWLHWLPTGLRLRLPGCGCWFRWLRLHCRCVRFPFPHVYRGYAHVGVVPTLYGCGLAVGFPVRSVMRLRLPSSTRLPVVQFCPTRTRFSVIRVVTARLPVWFFAFGCCRVRSPYFGWLV